MFRAILLVVLALFAATPALAEESRAPEWFKIEVLVFARQNSISDELWPLNLQPRYDSQAIRLSDPADSGADPQALARGAWQTLPEDDKILRYMLGRMQGTGKYRELFHEAWRQPIGSKRDTRPIYIRGGRSISTDDGTVPELEGTLHFSLQRYLHVDPRLWFLTQSNDKQFYVDIHQSRRMKSDEVTYFDHPKFGMLIRITKAGK
ncbi:MAG: peptidoglycan binding protein CsiV [Alcanivorax sp.]|nr:peptidoglycan binding protein CsiV [Alcanivorax sp.]